MSEHKIDLSWSRNNGPFERTQYSRDHLIRFEGGQIIKGSAAAEFNGNGALADPEQTLLAALSACHMLTFLAVAANRGYVVDDYQDTATAILDKNSDGKMAVVKALLAPLVAFSGDKKPSAEEYAKLHERAQSGCFIANSVKTEVTVVPR